tara:strand:- start:1438 stop:1896 length:459 start_codon:yes stop_codon:yes gene_type:complete
MKYLILILFFFTLSCSLNKVKNSHGIVSLKDKFNKINVNKSNTNDIIDILGPPSTKSTFDNNVWIYIERKKINRSIFKLGSQRIERNNVVVLEISSNGLLYKKEIFDLNNMNDYEFTKKTTTKNYDKNSYIYGVLSSLREKIDAPKKRRTKK